jgi:hypothetical protein
MHQITPRNRACRTRCATVDRLCLNGQHANAKTHWASACMTAEGHEGTRRHTACQHTIKQSCNAHRFQHLLQAPGHAQRAVPPHNLAAWSSCCSLTWHRLIAEQHSLLDGSTDTAATSRCMLQVGSRQLMLCRNCCPTAAVGPCPAHQPRSPGGGRALHVGLTQVSRTRCKGSCLHRKQHAEAAETHEGPSCRGAAEVQLLSTQQAACCLLKPRRQHRRKGVRSIDEQPAQ